MTRAALGKMHLKSPGMEFASEMIIAASHVGLTIAEIPVRYRKRTGVSKLHPFRDGLRHIKLALTS